MFEEIDVIKARRVPLIYRCPPFCEAEFSSTSEPIIVLNPIRRRRGPTGVRITNDGGIVTLSWDTVDGAICYNVYSVINFGQPDQSYILIAECITDPSIVVECPSPPCTYVVTVITPDGESDPSEPAVDDGPGTVCILRIVNYGSIAEPIFTAPVTNPPPNSADPEWDGIWNLFDDSAAPEDRYWYKGSNEVFSMPFGVGPNISVGGKAITYARITGPHAPGGPFTDPFWDVFILFEEQFVGAHYTWVGYKIGGDTSTPEGTYINGEVSVPTFYPPGSFSDTRLDIEVEFCEF